MTLLQNLLNSVQIKFSIFDYLPYDICICNLKLFPFVFRKRSLINSKHSEEAMQAKPRHLVRQESIHELENELSHLAPTVEGRIFMLDDIVSIITLIKKERKISTIILLISMIVTLLYLGLECSICV